ncbi:hypothetical protein [Kutzneria sp. 744]|uniref:hypothetical protein n=1 Tax=Kutzneria sp. (strain 744) TaxID=345341 RepID=UPI0012FB928A|nr:hypothetical protein [Kutzneria sp. 744]
MSQARLPPCEIVFDGHLNGIESRPRVRVARLGVRACRRPPGVAASVAQMRHDLAPPLSRHNLLALFFLEILEKPLREK